MKEFPSIAFGDSMLPLLEPMTEIWIQPRSIERIRIGEVAVYKNNGELCAHRVVKIRCGSNSALLTKGDNRLREDRWIRSCDLVGVVVRSGSNDLTAPRWQWINRVMVLLSYGPWSVCKKIIACLPRGKHLASRLATWFQPILIWNELSHQKACARLKPAARAARQRGVVLRALLDEDLSRISALWNRCFPDTPLTLEEFSKKICTTAWFSSKNCFVAEQGSKLVGFALTSQRLNAQGILHAPGTGFIEWLGVDPAFQRRGIGSLLLQQSLNYLGRKRCWKFSTGLFRVPFDLGRSIAVEPYVKFFGKWRFDVSVVSQEFQMYLDLWDNKITERFLERMQKLGVSIRLATSADQPSLGEVFRRWSVPEVEDGTFVVGVVDGIVRGVCHAAPWERSIGYGHPEWIWPALNRRRTVCIGSLRVDSDYRSLGMGGALVAFMLGALAQQGCYEARGGAMLPGLQIRYRRWKTSFCAHVLSMTKTPSWAS